MVATDGPWRWLRPERLVIGIGLAVLAGWTFGLTALTGMTGGWPSMKPNTAIATVLAGTGVWLSRGSPTERQRLAARACAVAILVVGSATLCEHLFGWDLGIDELVFHDAARAVATSAPGRMTVNSAVVFVLAGLALLLVDVERRGTRPTQVLAVAIGAIVLVPCAGYVFGAHSQAVLGSATRISLPGAVAHVLLGAALLMVRPAVGLMELATSPSPGGQTIRHLVVPSIAVPLAIGWVGQRGLRAGLYDRAQALAVVVVAIMVFFMALTWSTASALHRTDESRRRALAQFRSLLESAPDAIVAVDGEGVIRLVNRQAEADLGYDRRELVGQPVGVLVPERAREAHPLHQEAYLLDPASRPMAAGLSPTVRRKDGHEVPVDVRLSSLATDEGLLTLASLRDITARLAAEAEQARLHDLLLQAERDEERAAYEAKLQQAQRLETVGRLAGGVAHDFNNLLNAILNYADFVSGSLATQVARLGLEHDEAFALMSQDLGEIVKASERGATLTRQLLVFSRREVMRTEVLDLDTVVAEIEKLLLRTIGANIELRTLTTPDLPRIRADRGQIEQVLMNLVVNASDAMPQGGRLTIETAAVDVDEAYAAAHELEPGPFVRLSVSDTGEGMSPDVVAQAFEPFFTTKPQGKGTGLGLATVYGIAKQARGDVVIYSEPGLGTVVKVNLPALADPVPPQPERPPRPPRSLASTGETLLLVEDEEVVREQAQRVLCDHGYNVLAASCADEAIATAERYRGNIDVLVTDVVMPGGTGRSLAAAITRRRPHTKVLYMSGYSHDVVVHQGVIDDGATLLEKPFAAQLLLDKIRDVIERPHPATADP